MAAPNVVVATPGGNVTERMLVGEYLWFSISDAPQPAPKVREAFKLASIDKPVAGKRRKIAGYQVRTMLRHYLEENGAEMVRDAVYFVPRDAAFHATRVLAALAAIYGRVDAHRALCLDHERERAFLEDRFADNCTRDLSALSTACVEMRQSAATRTRAFRRDRIANLKAECDRCEARIGRWERLLKHPLPVLRLELVAARAAYGALTQAVEAREAA